MVKIHILLPLRLNTPLVHGEVRLAVDHVLDLCLASQITTNFCFDSQVLDDVLYPREKTAENVHKASHIDKQPQQVKFCQLFN